MTTPSEPSLVQLWLHGGLDLSEQLQKEPPECPAENVSAHPTPHRDRTLVEQGVHRSLRLYNVLAGLLCVVLSALMLLTAADLPPYGSDTAPTVNEVARRYVEQGTEETGAVNTVAGMILDYRAFDTLGESHVLFIAACSVLILLRVTQEKKRDGSLSQEKQDAALPELSEGQVLECAEAAVKEGKTTPPRHFTEDTLLSAMETAGKEDMPEEAERKGLGTPATRAAIIEKLVATGFVERKRAKKSVSLVPAHTGVSLITVLPEQLQSPLLTAEWEYRLQQVERGELSPDEFMTGIAEMLTELVKTYQVISGAEVLFPSGREIIGKCPRCGGEVSESKKGFFCERNDCRFGLWRDNKFFAAKHVALTKKIAAALLADGRVKLTGLYSEKTGGTYDAAVVLEDTGESVRFRLEFDKGART